MKYPQPQIIKIPNCVKYIRFGIGWDGFWFWEVITKYRGETGIGFAFSTNFGEDRETWQQYNEYLFTLPEVDRKRKVLNIVRKLEKLLIRGPHTYGGIYKFDTKRLFTLIKRHK